MLRDLLLALYDGDAWIAGDGANSGASDRSRWAA